MCINLMIKYGVKKIYLAGYDGYSHIPSMDYYDDKYILQFKNDNKNLNLLIKNEILNYKKKCEIEFVTESLYDENMIS